MLLKQTDLSQLEFQLHDKMSFELVYAQNLIRSFINKIIVEVNSQIKDIVTQIIEFKKSDGNSYVKINKKNKRSVVKSLNILNKQLEEEKEENKFNLGKAEFDDRMNMQDIKVKGMASQNNVLKSEHSISSFDYIFNDMDFICLLKKNQYFNDNIVNSKTEFNFDLKQKSPQQINSAHIQPALINNFQNDWLQSFLGDHAQDYQSWENQQQNFESLEAQSFERKQDQSECSLSRKYLPQRKRIKKDWSFSSEKSKVPIQEMIQPKNSLKEELKRNDEMQEKKSQSLFEEQSQTLRNPQDYPELCEDSDIQPQDDRIIRLFNLLRDKTSQIKVINQTVQINTSLVYDYFLDKHKVLLKSLKYNDSQLDLDELKSFLIKCFDDCLSQDMLDCFENSPKNYKTLILTMKKNIDSGQYKLTITKLPLIPEHLERSILWYLTQKQQYKLQFENE
eukprot:403357838